MKISYKVEFFENNQWHEEEDWLRPFTDGITLDESLDSGKINLGTSPRKKPYSPFTRVRISIYEAEDTTSTQPVDVLHYLVESDEVKTVRWLPTKLYNHSISLIELTKELERNICDTMTVTNYLGHDYSDGVFQIFAQKTTGNINGERQIGYMYGPKLKDSTIIIPESTSLFSLPNDGVGIRYYWNGCTVIVVNPLNETVINRTFETSSTEISFIGDYTGTYSIQFNMTVQQRNIITGDTQNLPCNYIMSLSVFENIPSSENWTITKVVNRLLSAGVTRRIGIDKQKYVFDSTQAELFDKVNAPEFAFTRSTLFEALMTVGGYIHGIARLVPVMLTDDSGNSYEQLTVRYDLLGEVENYSGTLPPAIFEEEFHLGNEYCGTLDSVVENLINTTDKNQGAVVEPADGGWRAVNSASGNFIISNDTLEIQTDQPINQVIKLECRYNGKEYDLTPFVYENAEYQTISGYTGETYPYSKGYAVEYSSGQKNIRRLSFTLETTSGGTFANQQSIVNILQSQGADITSSSNLPNGLAFRVTYIPIVTTRIVQRKPYLTHPVDNALIYNQGGNAVECEYYGERLKGTIARIGNVVARRTYEFHDYQSIPKPGQKIGDEYVAVVEREFERRYIKATITTVKNFNKLAEYLGVQSNYRLFDVSEKQSVDRYINYSESCVLSHYPIGGVQDGRPLISLRGIYAFVSGLANYNSSGTYLPASSMRLQFGEGIGEIQIACGSVASGNSLVFYADMLDNYGAGYQSADVGDANKRGQRLVPYGNAQGNLSTVRVAIVDRTSSNDVFSYPEASSTSLGNIYFQNIESGAFLIDKDSREALRFIIQQHFQSDDVNIIIGSALTQNCSLVKKVEDEHRGKLYFLTHEINYLNKIIDVSGLTGLDYTVSTTGFGSNYITLNLTANNTGATAYSWAIVDPLTGELYLGENYPNGIAAGQTPNPIYFNFLDNKTYENYYNSLEH